MLCLMKKYIFLKIILYSFFINLFFYFLNHKMFAFNKYFHINPFKKQTQIRVIKNYMKNMFITNFKNFFTRTNILNKKDFYSKNIF